MENGAKKSDWGKNDCKWEGCSCCQFFKCDGIKCKNDYEYCELCPCYKNCKCYQVLSECKDCQCCQGYKCILFDCQCEGVQLCQIFKCRLKISDECCQSCQVCMHNLEGNCCLEDCKDGCREGLQDSTDNNQSHCNYKDCRYCTPDVKYEPTRSGTRDCHYCEVCDLPY